MRYASSRPLWLLLSAAVAFGVLGWSAQREPGSSALTGHIRVVVLPQPGSSTLTYTYSPAGTGFFRRDPPITISGIDTVTRDGGSTSCLIFTRGHGSVLTATVSRCVSGTARGQLRKLP